MIEQSCAEAILNAALSTGGDFAEIFMEDSHLLNLSSLDGRIENANKIREFGAGIRILSGINSIYAYSNDCSQSALIQTAYDAASALRKKNSSLLKSISFASSTHKLLSPIELYPNSVEQKDKVNILHQAYRVAKSESSEITQVSCSYSDKDQKIFVCNSAGVWAQDRRIRTRITVNAVASNGTEFETGYDAPGYSMGFEVFKKNIDPEQVAKTAARQAIIMLHAEECPAANVPVVINGGFGGVIFHEACGHSLEATSVGKGNSVFCDQLGQQIANERVNALDDGTIPHAWGTLNMDDEGKSTQKNLLIEKGILKGYLIDHLGSRRMNMPTTGSARRQNYTYAPTSRMNNTFIASGTDDENLMIKSIDEGLFAKSMGGGSVNPLTGEFNFSVREGYWIKKGDLIPVRGATLIGKGAEILMNIDRVGTNMWMGAGVCGSISGHVPTNVGQPRIRVRQMTVGGKGGSLL